MAAKRRRRLIVESLENRLLMAAKIGTSPAFVDPNLGPEPNQPGSALIGGGGGAGTGTVAATFPLDQTFLLHSRPSASKVIYLDFNGHTVANTAWNDFNGGQPFTLTGYNFEGDSSFSNNELQRIQNIWLRVVEDFAPFDVNVTTQEPPLEDLINSGGTDTRWGVRTIIGSTFAPFASAGGVAFLTSFTWDSDTPALVFEDNLGNGAEKPVAEATSHEVGHTLGLNHDGRTTPSEAYYQGHGTGPTGWAPIMGVGYNRELVQWSDGAYLNANNREDDLAIITTDNGFGYRRDDFGSTIATALPIAATGTLTFDVNQGGIIERRTDFDFFRLDSGDGLINLNLAGAPISPNLDILAELYDANGVLIASSNPANALGATISQVVTAGTYYLKVDGVGVGNPSLGNGYTDYASIGEYRITGTFESNVPPTKDYGDAPASYLVTDAAGGPNHLVTGPTLGALRDAERNGFPSAGANSDDTFGRDDEDGVSFDTDIALSQTFGVTVRAPDGGVLNAWFDLNRNGRFDATERLLSERTLTAGDNSFQLQVPSTASQGASFARFRITSATGMATTPGGSASDGEVEDYAITIRGRAPGFTGEVINGAFTNTNRSGLGSLQLKFDTPVILRDKSDLVLINRTTNQKINLATTTLKGNGTAQITWEFPATLAIPNGRYTYELIRVGITDMSGTDHPVSNVAGTFHILRGDVTGDARVNQSDIMIVNSNLASNLLYRFRPGDANGDGRVTPADSTLVSASFNASGLAPLGLDFGDAPETGTAFASTLAKNGARHASSAGPRLGTAWDAETNAVSNVSASGDGADEDGVTFAKVTTGIPATFTVRMTGATQAFVNGWIDRNGDGDWLDAGERVMADSLIQATSSLAVTLTFGFNTPSTIYARFRVTSLAGYTQATGFAGDGEVEDYLITVVPPVGSIVATSSNSAPNLGSDKSASLGQTVSGNGGSATSGLPTLAPISQLPNVRDRVFGSELTELLSANTKKAESKEESGILGGSLLERLAFIKR